MKPSSQTTLYLIGLCAVASAMAAEEEPVIELEEIKVISSTPLPGSDIEMNKVPTNVQKVSAKEIQKSQSLSVADYMNQYLGGVTINEAQSNPLQPDINYRGFVASPLMGMPQGLSMYVNGVRFNEPFGDSVNWDLLPPGAIQSMELHGGSNPVYGLNTLGGAISVRTKTGFDFGKTPQHQLEVSGGSFGRHNEELTSGWNNGTFGYFLDLRNFNEDGWRDYSNSAAKQILGSVSWRNDKANVDVTLASNDNKMKGNGAVPIQLFNQDRNAVFTHPDQTITRMFFSEIAGSYALTDKIKLSADAYFRQNQMRSFNGDAGNAHSCGGKGKNKWRREFICQDGDFVLDSNGDRIRKNTPNVLGAINNTSQTNMRSEGGSVQAAFSEAIFGHKNNLSFGATYDVANVHYAADTELASLTATRGTIGGNVLTQADRVRLNTSSTTYSAYFTDSFSITDALTMTVGGRYNHTTLELKNQLIENPDKLSGKHSFERFNPSAGFTYQWHPALTFFGNYSESARAPTAMELSCADENDPCKLPNAFLADPPLAQVVAKTWESGVRGSLKPLFPKVDGQWNLGYFRSTNFNDIIFNRNGNNISSGFFSNVGQTRRHGIEAGLSANYSGLFSGIDDWHFSTNYTYLNARYKTSFTNQNPLDNTQAITVMSGSRIPGLPEHSFKASLGVELWKKASLTVDGLYSGAQYLRGDEANSTSQLTGYWLFNLRTEVKLDPHLTIFARVNNLFDHKYQTFGVYGNASDLLGDDYNDGRFVSPGAPRAGWVGIRLSL
jgi:outer membrane receptor protein involved in Fe transport